MSFEELIEVAERRVKSARENFMKGHLEAAKNDLLVVAAKVIGMLPEPADQHAPSPGKMRW